MRDRRIAAFCVLVILWAVHVWATWGEAGLFWGDYGRWLHEVDRFAHGEIPYRDYYWAFPPMAVWVFGWVGRLFGTEVEVIRVATTILSLMIYLAFFAYAKRLVPRELLPEVIAAGVILSAAYAQIDSVPLPEGMYIPAAPLGFLFLLCALLCFFREDWILLGFCCGLCILTKQDFWLPAVYLVFVGLRKSRWIAASFLLTVLAGIAVVWHQTGWQTLIGIPGGFGQVAEFSGRGLPTLERLTVEVIALAVLVFGLWCSRQIFGSRDSFTFSPLVILPLVALHIFMEQDWRALRTQYLLHFFPALLPAFVLAVVLPAKRPASPERRILLFLLGLCVLCRARRLFEHVEWYQLLLEIPVYVLVLQFLFPGEKTIRAMRVCLVALMMVGAYSYWFWGAGRLTRQGPGVWLETAKGTIRVSPAEDRYYHELMDIFHNIDPRGERGLFAFGYTGGFNYFLGRRNPSPLTQGFRFSSFPPDKVLADLESDNPIPLDNSALLHDEEPVTKPDFSHWKMRTRPGPYSRFDRPLFERLIAGCIKVATIPRIFGEYFTVYDCQR